MSEVSPEGKLQNLVAGNSRLNRDKWALDWRKKGRKVIGAVCSYVPTEVVYAAGMLPWRITGSWSTNIHPQAAVHRPGSGDFYYTHVLDARVKGDLDFLDGAVFTSKDDDMKRLYDVWAGVDAYNTPFTHIMWLPHHNRESAQHAFQSEILQLITGLETFAKRKISQKSLLDAIKEYNKMRNLLLRLYQLRKREKPAISGSEVLGITTAAQVMPVDLFNQELESLLPYLEGRTAKLSKVQPRNIRLMVSSDALDNPDFIQLIEEMGAIVVMDDLDTGSRWFWQEVDMDEARQDPVKALARRYLGRPACPRMGNWDEQIEQAIAWAKEYKVDGVVDFTALNNYTRQFRVPVFRKALQAAGIPTFSLTRDYCFTGVGQLKTRIEGFLETLTR